MASGAGRRRDRIPAYVVAHDVHLRAIAAQRPRTLEALLAVDGIGPTKAERYGDEILALVGEPAPPAEGLTGGSEVAPARTTSTVVWLCWQRLIPRRPRIEASANSVMSRRRFR